MTDFQAAKSVARRYMSAFDAAPRKDRASVLNAHTTPDYRWRGVHPFHELDGTDAVMTQVWDPYLAAFSAPQRREQVFFAGLNDCDGQATTWTCSMGHMMGLFDAPWLGIPPTGKLTMLRYAEFHRIEGDRIAETGFFCDILAIMRQAGVYPLPGQTGASLVVPNPLTNDGVLTQPQDPEDGPKTLATIKAMAANINTANQLLKGEIEKPNFTPREELALTWTDDMAWYGPEGIGATFTIDRYIEQHQQPFRRQLANRVFNGHVARFAEGMYGGFFGWPNLYVTPTGGYLGLPGTGEPAPMRVVDVYRRAGDKLAENWVIIDMLHWLNCQGLDVLARLAELEPRRR